MQMRLFDEPTNDPTPKTFVDNMQLPIHRWYRYPAGFSSEWVKELIQARQGVVEKVLDPFCGSGTTLIAADECGVNSIGVDAHPFIARIARAKLHWSSDAKLYQQHILALLELAQTSYHQGQSSEEVPPLIEKSYSALAVRKLFSLRNAWQTLRDDSPASELTWLTITSILRISSQVGTAPWQYVLPKKQKSQVLDPFEALKITGQMILKDMCWMQSQTNFSPAQLIQGDARTLEDISSRSIDLVITSPPYINNYDYADSTRLEMTYWGEINGWGDLQESVRKYLVRSCTQHVSAEKLILEELVADPLLVPVLDELVPLCQELAEERHLHGGKKPYHLMVAAYFSDMARVWYALRRVCREEAEICFVIGDSAPYGIHVPVEQWLARLAREVDYRTITFTSTRERNIKWANRTHSVPLKEGVLWVSGTSSNGQGEITDMNRATSAGHKLGQLIGNFFESIFETSLTELANKHRLYCDRKGLRPQVRGTRTKVTWHDATGTPHDLDYVLERGGSTRQLGQPSAFIELTWRRYTKHSRNKAGEIEGALLHLGNSFAGAFLGAILAGEWSQQSLEQLERRGVHVLLIPFETIADTFALKEIDLRYAENAPDQVKWNLITQWDALTDQNFDELRQELLQRVFHSYQDFLMTLDAHLARQATSIRVLQLYGRETFYSTVQETIQALSTERTGQVALEFVRLEIEVHFSNADRLTSSFQSHEEALAFLERLLS